MQSGPTVQLTYLKSVGPKLIATAEYNAGLAITQFDNHFSISMDLSVLALTPYKLETLAMYASKDGIIWDKLSSTVDLKNKKISAEVNHFSQFAVIAERKDTIIASSLFIDGKKVKKDPYYPHADVEINTLDNKNGSSLDYILLKLDDDDWITYKTPLHLNTRGHHVVEYYSV